jgi:colicin import membrane protein
MNLLLLALLLPLAAAAQDDEDAKQRARIAAERTQAEAVFQAQEKACYGRFAVDDCLNAAKAQRRNVLADLRRQELSLNEALRKRKAADHLRSIEERSRVEPRSPKERRENPRVETPRAPGPSGRPSDRVPPSGERVAPGGRGQDEIKRRQAQAAAQRSRRQEAAERNVARQKERLAAAQERKADRDKRLTERNKLPAQPLPAP